jgi:NADH-quinone oxidoreductase subunit J
MNATDVYANYALIGLLVIAALWTVLTPTLLRSAIGLAITSAILTLIMFQMKSPLAGVFELSVCAGLITVVFVSTISLTRAPQGEQAALRKIARMKAFLPVIPVGAIVAGILWATGYALDVKLPQTRPGAVRDILWNTRQFDLLGQILIIFVGVFGVVVLFKERKGGPRDVAKEDSR